MRIVILGSAHPLRGGGIASFNERLAYALQEQGHQVDIYSFSLQYPHVLFPGKSQYTEEPAPVGLSIFSKVNSINPFNWIKVGRELKKAEYDLLIVRYWMPFFALCLGTIQRIVHKNKKTKIVCIADNIVPHERRWGDINLTRYFLHAVDGCITMSKAVLENLKQIAPGMPARCTPHPLYDNYGEKLEKSEARTLLNLSPDEKIILFFGFIRRYKGLDLLLEAMHDPRLRDMRVRLLVVGEYYDRAAHYQAIIDKYELQSQIILQTDFVPNDKVAQYFSASDCVVLPYRSATQSGITQVAYHFSLPMIATNVGGLPEIVKDGVVGFVVEPDPRMIADALVRFYDEKREQDFVRHIEAEKRKYNWTTFVNEIFSIVNDKNSGG
ncbi:glycosyltransferase [Sphingobacterium sp. SGG-5]|uniref:glycosyltransferase n=1 Tax=Sphingobacterium sp. SGG-5 TaxID=2710881 RepID=UPI0013EA60D3|nr:glycosyltransferase [Sphingobacterium sp. SGG-5]NGM61517.1 glycosyltransferase [Sphingobacterium sp. SGG-5]